MRSCWLFPASLKTLGWHQGESHKYTDSLAGYLTWSGLVWSPTVASNVDTSGKTQFSVASMLKMLLANRICKDEVIADFEKEVKKIKEVKLYSSRQPGLLQQMETFLMVKFAACRFTTHVQKCQNELLNTSCGSDPSSFYPFILSFLRGPRQSWLMWSPLSRSSMPWVTLSLSTSVKTQLPSNWRSAAPSFIHFASGLTQRYR